MLAGAGIGGILLAMAIAAGGYKAGYAVAALDAAGKENARLDRIIVRERVVAKEVPKIVEKVVTKTVTVTKEVERVVTKIQHDIPPDCVLPDRYGVLLVAAARGLDPDAPGVADALAGTYGCREVLAATLADLRAGYINTARLEGLQAWARVVTSPQPSKGESP
jgi:hypothetical protein